MVFEEHSYLVIDDTKVFDVQSNVYNTELYYIL